MSRPLAKILPPALALAFGLAVAAAAGNSGASKNRQGNRLFEEGKFQDAEKAYLEAQLDDPGRPELVYNLGNALLRQKKYDQALQSLRQAVSKGDQGIQANGWFNLGNALYERGNYKDSAQAYIQSLRINPGDRDAKHNLEMALRKMQEQQQSASGEGQQDDRQKDSQEQQQQAGDSGADDRQERQQDAPAEEKPAREQESKAAQAEQQEGSISKDKAEQILDALQNREIAEQRKLLEQVLRRKGSGKDW